MDNRYKHGSGWRISGLDFGGDNMSKMIDLIYEAIDEVNETLGAPIEKKEETVLFGKDSILDSM